MIDLHTHSCASDGTVAPEKLPELAAAINLSAVALTDHDTVAGVDGFLTAAKHFPQLVAVPGVELSTNFSSKEIHIVGLFIDHRNEALLDFLAAQRAERCRRNEMIFLKLKSLGYPLAMDEPEFARFSDASSIGRPHFAAALCRRYGFADSQDVFHKLLGHNRPAYVRRKTPEPAAAIEVIHAAHGVAVWAHPVYRQRNESAFVRRFCRRFAPLGLDALECYYSLFGPPETQMLLQAAHDFNLSASGGSDFHGDHSSAQLGVGMGGLSVPDELLDTLIARKNDLFS